MRLVVLALFGAGLIACGGGDAPPPTAQTPAAGVAPQPAAPAQDAPAAEEPAASEDTRSAVELFQAAGKALADERLFEPRGDNALELYLKVIDHAAEGETQQDDARRRRLSDSVGAGDLKSQAEIALADIFPYGLLWVDRAIRENRKSEAERVLDLLEKAQPGAESIARLRKKLTEPEPLPAPVAPTPTTRQTPAPAAQAPTPAPAQPSTSPSAQPSTPPAAQPSTPAPAQPAPAEPAAAQPTPPPAPVVEEAPVQLKLKKSASPRYPSRAYRQKIEGYVVVAFTVYPNGKVGDLRVVEADPEGVFDRDAMDAVSRFEFDPPGRQVPTQQRIDFKIR